MEGPSSDATASMQPESRIPEFRDKEVKIKYVYSGYSKFNVLGTALTAVLVPLLSYLVWGLSRISWKELTTFVHLSVENTHVTTVAIACGAIVVLLLFYYLTKTQEIYLVDFAVWKGRPELAVSHQMFSERSRAANVFDEKSLEFQEKILATSTIRDDSFFPPGIMQNPQSITMASARLEAEMVMFDCVGEVLNRHGLKGRDIDILIVNCSLFCPTPSLSAMIVNKFQMRSDVLSYNLGGMGCSAGVIAIDLAKQLLQLHKKSYAVVMSTENITLNWYQGKERSMLISNTLFRCGGAAILLSNHPKDRSRSKYRILHTVRTHKGADPACYSSVFQEEDACGLRGVRLSKDIMRVAGDALRTNITTLGPLTFPFVEQVKFFLNLCARQLLKQTLPKPVPKPIRVALYKVGGALLAPKNSLVNRALRSMCQLPAITGPVPVAPQSPVASATAAPSTPEEGSSVPKKAAVVDPIVGNPYIPDFTKAFQHFCIHAGGRAVIEAVQKNLCLPEKHVEASRETLATYGNTSSSSIWYELAYHERHSNVRKGDRVWQIAFGSGFKCNSVVWESLVDIVNH